MGDDLEATKTRRQALVTLDKLEESPEARDYDDAADAHERLGDRIDELRGGESDG